MKRVFLFVFGLLSFVPAMAYSNFLQDLEELGYCVVPEVLSTSEAELLYQRVWQEFIEKAWPNCKMHDRSNWKEAFPQHSRMGIFAGAAGQTQVMWDLRQDPRIVDVFAHLWNTDDLIVSMDGMSIMCPTEIRDGYFEPWPHVDQTISQTENFVSESLLKTEPYTVQGQFLFEDSCDGDGGFYCIPKSHLRFSEFAPQLELGRMKELDRVSFLKEFFSRSSDESGQPYCMKHITAPRGSLILWDSRTVHWNQHPRVDRPHSSNPRVRMVGYLCYVPKARLTDAARVLRREAFEKGVATCHNPVQVELKYTKEHMHREFERHLEDPSYAQPQIQLTPLGESLLGF